jgi:hypothetical protein
MNNAKPEVESLKSILPILTEGGCIVVDDYCWYGNKKQKIAIDPIVKDFGLNVM